MEQGKAQAVDRLNEEFGNAECIEARARWIKLRRLEIAATLAEWKRAFFADGVEHKFEDRLTLEAESAALALEARVIGGEVEAAKVKRRNRQNASTFAQLVALLNERGMSEFVAEAEKRAADAVT